MKMLTKDERLAIYDKLLEVNGLSKQMIVSIEEMAEAVKELCKVSRGIGDSDHLAEEIADALNTLEQMIHFFHLEDSVERWRDYKARRSLDDAEGRPRL